jgi:hypothetical protein
VAGGSHALRSLVPGSDGEPRPFVRAQPITSAAFEGHVFGPPLPHPPQKAVLRVA